MSLEQEMNSSKNTARLAGVLYFIWILTGVYGIFFLPSQTVVKGNAAATANKILANEFLFRTGIVNDIISNTLWIFIALILYRLFKQVNERYTKLLVALVIVQIPAMFFMEAFNISSLMLFKGKILKSFELAQRQDLAMMFLDFNGYIALVLETFWGLWLIPFGQLVYKSGFIPRILGTFLILNGAAYVVHSFTSLLFPDYQATVRLFAFPFWILGEISIMLWLLIKGVKTKHLQVSQ
jgi:hypothetical protein